MSDGLPNTKREVFGMTDWTPKKHPDQKHRTLRSYKLQRLVDGGGWTNPFEKYVCQNGNMNSPKFSGWTFQKICLSCHQLED